MTFNVRFRPPKQPANGKDYVSCRISHFLAARAGAGGGVYCQSARPTQWSIGAGGSSALQWLKVPSNREGAGERRHKQQQGWHWAEGPPGSSARQLATGESLNRRIVLDRSGAAPVRLRRLCYIP
ncbi:hypothetical protein E4U09_007590 [Claviceps aff. purpurea]|uniref:Uncharacterized protein n=1 Tax=Claviceps aff. purpurea TaxID=1967640 RepID=A0A9P7U581_9HYPO|nr:hypothetical protein E4U09_007590 [Claviceps aff. purpurea]